MIKLNSANYLNKYRNHKILVIMIVCLLLICSCYKNAYGKKEPHKLPIKLKVVVLNDTDGISKNDYVLGKEYYPHYSYEGLPESFLIKKTADISIMPEEVKSIEIAKMPWVPKDLDDYVITIKLKDSAAKILMNFTNQNLNNKIALEINNEIFIILSVMAPIKDVMKFTIGNRPLNKIQNYLYLISDDIDTKIQ